ncbi:hypothetical protein GCM10025868_31380 [Angustibacter aerolatus]|uniref:Uncharacterized protein n=1 Tax=Angustibacter aerolatus TaxID=1162965 RepID=A0ABQ6JKF1_9ACTN|nr:hypothetical protein GCM10025868_31380 [Angustibacter aerolatus]
MYSGSGSVGSVSPARAGRALPSASVSGTERRPHDAGRVPARSSTCTRPAGACGRSPSSPPGGVASSSRSFSIAIAAYRPEGATAIESGCPASGTDRTVVRSLIRTTSSRPDGAVYDGLVFTTTSA